MKEIKNLALGVLVVGLAFSLIGWLALGVSLFATGHYVAAALVLTPFGLAFCWAVGKGLMEG